MPNRRQLLSAISALAVGTPVFHRALVAAVVQDEDGKLTKESLADAQWVCGLELSEEQQETVLKSVNANRGRLEPMREMAISELQSPPFHFTPLTKKPAVAGEPDRSIRLTESSVGKLPESDEEIAFLSVTELAPLLQSRQLTSRRLTEIYLGRLKKYGDMLDASNAASTIYIAGPLPGPRMKVLRSGDEGILPAGTVGEEYGFESSMLQ